MKIVNLSSRVGVEMQKLRGHIVDCFKFAFSDHIDPSNCVDY